jgi:hypothetical protein
MKTHSLSHVAMSVPPGTLTDTYRKEVLDFYGELFDWREIEDLRLPDRLTIAIGRHFYINLREQPNAATTNGYEHFGVLVRSAEYLEDVRNKLRANYPDVPVADQEGSQFRFQHLLPFAVEVQYFPDVA